MTLHVVNTEGTNYTLSGGDTKTAGLRLVGIPFCPDLLRYELLGEADNLRGRVVRGFFWLMQWWKP